MEITEKQQAYIKEAITLLLPFDKEDVSNGLFYFSRAKGKDEEELESEYDCCDLKKCINATAKELRKEFKGSKIIYYHSLGGDTSNINRCYQCFRPLNESLTWAEDELEHWENTYLTKARLQDSGIAFDLRVMLESMPTCDESFSGYDTHQKEIGNPAPYNEKLQRQKEFVRRVVRVAKRIIKNIKINNADAKS